VDAQAHHFLGGGAATKSTGRLSVSGDGHAPFGEKALPSFWLMFVAASFLTRCPRGIRLRRSRGQLVRKAAVSAPPGAQGFRGR
jgi:hypothetical protein